MKNVVRLALPGRSDRPISELVDDFLADMRAAGKSPATVRNYERDVRALALWFHGDVEAASSPVLREYMRGLEGLAPATRARHRVSVRAFFRWAAEMELIGSDPAERLPKVKVPEAQPRALRPGEVERVLGAVTDKRDRLLFQIMFETGLRISEALSVRLERIRLDAQEITVVGKGGRERTVYLIRTEALGMLRRFLRAQGWLGRDGETITQTGLLFRPTESKQRSGKAGEPIDYTTVQQRWKRYCKAAKVEATIHQLRHTYATRLVNEGKPLEIVQKILGHRNPQTTQRYAAVSDETVRRALEAD